MKVSGRTISALGKVLTGDGGLSPYKSGPQLIRFFSEFGPKDDYGSGFPSRWKYAEDKLQELNGTPKLATAIEMIVDPRNYLGTQFNVEEVINLLNGFLQPDGFELEKSRDTFRVSSQTHDIIVAETTSGLERSFIQAHLTKCDKKYSEGDYAGAITNARSLVESVMLEVFEAVSGDKHEYDGDLTKLYRQIQKLMSFDPSRQDIDDCLRQMFSGLTSIVVGISTARNKMGDAHATDFKAEKRHAKLVINSARMLTEFLIETYEQMGDSSNRTV